MASDTEACSSPKRIKLDTTESDAIDEISDPKIDNLEYFPVEMLMKIFASCNDVKLLDLASISYRFDGVAKVVFQKRYSTKYIVIEPNAAYQQQWFQAFSHFGTSANNIKIIEAHDWSAEIDNILLQPKMEITYLQFQRPHYFNNVPIFEIEVAEQIFRNNPAMKTLILHGIDFNFYDMMLVIAQHLTQLKELDLVGIHNTYWDAENQRELTPKKTINWIVDSLKYLESLKLFVDRNNMRLLRRFGFKCKNIRELGLQYYPYYDFYDESKLWNFETELIDVVGRFKSVQSLALSYWPNTYAIKSAVEKLPNLRHLHLLLQKPSTTSFILSLMRKCQSLETITINSAGYHLLPHMNVSFYNEMIETMKEPNGKVELKSDLALVGYVTKNEIVWINKLMHWTEYDASYNQSNIHLLDLASAKNTGQQSKIHPFDHILEYLDLSSLYSLSETSKKCKKLVENFVQRHSQQHGLFTISDELHSDGNGLDTFAQHIQNLSVSIFNIEFTKHLATAVDTYKNLNKFQISFFIKNGIYRLEKGTLEHKCTLIYPQYQNFAFNEVFKSKEIWLAGISNTLRQFKNWRNFF